MKIEINFVKNEERVVSEVFVVDDDLRELLEERFGEGWMDEIGDWFIELEKKLNK